jgi:hypothetical protein
MAIVEGKTEQMFIENVLAPYLLPDNICIKATQVSKKGQKGGSVKFERAVRDIGNHLRQQQNAYVTTFIDYYGTSDWPGIEKARATAKTPLEIATIINEETKAAVCDKYRDVRADVRFIPYVSVHEFEALLFSNSNILSDYLGIEVSDIDDILRECGEPEAINNSNETAPSKRLQDLMPGGNYKKTSTGIEIARQIGIDAMRKACPIFDNWVSSIKM